MSKEAYLLMACIHSCRGNWGLNLPIHVLRGSRVSFLKNIFSTNEQIVVHFYVETIKLIDDERNLEPGCIVLLYISSTIPW